MSGGIVSREQELGSLHAFVERVADGPAALVLTGEAGIGKSTLWLAGVDEALSCGLRVLSSRTAEAERGLAYAGLGDLFDFVLGDVLPALSAPRRRALEVALLLEEADDTVDPRALGLAIRDALELLAAETPLLVAIDDVQWFDDSSSAALAFALRRLTAARVGLLLAQRVDDTPARAELEHAVGVSDVERLIVGPLTLGALHRLLRDRLGRSFARQTLVRIHETSGGNPFFALELGRVLDADVDPVRPLPVPDTLEELVRARFVELPARTREALALIAALGPTSVGFLERAGVAPDALDAAVVAQVIERENGTIRFAHPLLPSVLYHDLGEARRGVHARIAGLVDDPVFRARHLALSTDRPDADVATTLDDAARAAAVRGAPAVAAELSELALRLTPPDEDDDRGRRALAAARAQHAAGEWTRARTIATELLNETEVGGARAEALVFLAELESVDRAADLLAEALQEADSQPALQSEILCRLAWAARFRQGFAGARDYAQQALDLAEELDDDTLRVGALLKLTVLGNIVGAPDAPTHAVRAHDIATALGDDKLLRETTVALSTSISDSDDERALLEREYDKWRQRDEPWSAELLWRLAWVELLTGRWEVAADHAARARNLNSQYGLERPPDSIPVALIAAHRGQLELARAESERALALADEQLGLHPPMLLAILGLVAHWGGNAEAGAVWLDAAERQAATLGWGGSVQRWWTADHVEALLELGRHEDAVLVLDAWEADATRSGRKWVLAAVTRCRGLVAAAEGDVSRASDLLEDAVEQHQDAGDPFGRARALLALGSVRRRARQKRPAREAIEAALDGFEQLGAATWVEKARGELGRIGGRTREGGLTPAEHRVAALVAEGRTNREVAAALFLGERTVASHLTRVYGKLGVRSRTELARRLRDEPRSTGKDQTF